METTSLKAIGTKYRAVMAAARAATAGAASKAAAAASASASKAPSSFSSNPKFIGDAFQIVQRSYHVRQLLPKATRISEGITGQCGIYALNGWRKRAWSVASVNYRFPFYSVGECGAAPVIHCSYRSFASSTSDTPRKNPAEDKKDISTVEDPFDAPTYHIPEKPVTFAEGASYSVIILVGLGIAAAAAYAVFKELIFEPKEYKIFSKALDRVQNDGQVRVRIGSPIKGYGQESRNRAARQRIPNRMWTDEDGVEHVEVNFHVRGPHGGGKVYCEMFKDNSDKQWKFMYLIVDILQPTPAQLILESFLPA